MGEPFKRGFNFTSDTKMKFEVRLCCTDNKPKEEENRQETKVYLDLCYPPREWSAKRFLFGGVISTII